VCICERFLPGQIRTPRLSSFPCKFSRLLYTVLPPPTGRHDQGKVRVFLCLLPALTPCSFFPSRGPPPFPPTLLSLCMSLTHWGSEMKQEIERRNWWSDVSKPASCPFQAPTAPQSSLSLPRMVFRTYRGASLQQKRRSVPKRVNFTNVPEGP